MTERVLILGGAGFIGACLAIGLKNSYSGWQIVCFDNLRRRGSELNLVRLRNHGVEFVHGDIRSSSDLDGAAISPPALIIDCSAEPSVLAGVTSPDYVLQTNLIGTINVLELCRRTGARLLFLSTSRVYSVAALRNLKLSEDATRFSLAARQTEAHVGQLGIREEFSTRGFRSLYGTTKLASEMLIEEYSEAFALKAIINRCAVITGPWQMGKVDQGVFVLWVAAHHFARNLEYIGFGGTGKQVRDLLHIDDLLKLVKFQLEQFDALQGEVFNVGGGSACNLSLLETTKLCRDITGKTITVEKIAGERRADIPLFITDNHKVTARTGWSPSHTPMTILQDIHLWIRENEEALRPVLS